MAKITQKAQFEKAKQVIPGGVHSSTRFNKALNMPFYVRSGTGSKVTDIEGKKYIDMCCAHGAGLLGNAHPVIDQALLLAREIGYVNSFETIYHEKLARLVCESVECADRVRFCSSGSEATLHLIRACRAFTGKNKIIRVEGHFHGYHEMIYIGGHPTQEAFKSNRQDPFIESPGIPAEFAEFIIPVPFNDIEVLKETVEKHAHEAGLLILEPINFNCGGIRADLEFLELARELTLKHNIVLFFDEIQSAFKMSNSAAQNVLGVIPDVSTIGKSLGGGLPLSAFCGREEIMDLYQPVGQVQHSGTFNAHLIPVLAGLAFLEEASKAYFYPTLKELESQLHSGIDRLISELDLNMIVPHFGARFNVVLGRRSPPRNYQGTFCHSNELFLKIIRDCWERGVYFHDYGGGPVHHGYSIQHSREDVERVLEVLSEVFSMHKEELNK